MIAGMFMNWFLMGAALISSIAGGGNDLLDYVTPASYWQTKHVEVSVSTMRKELAPPAPQDVSKLVAGLSSPDPTERLAAARQLTTIGAGALPGLQAALDSEDPQLVAAAKPIVEQIVTADKPAAVRRLMAIRALGESKSVEAVTVLQPLLQSSSPIEAEYAAQAIALIKGEAFVRPVVADASRQSDVMSLPTETGAIVQIAAHDGRPVEMDKLFARMTSPAMVDITSQVGQIQTQLIVAAERLGNVRFDLCTVGISGVIGDQVGSVFFELRGQYDPKAALAWVVENGGTAKVVNGYDVVSLGENAMVIFASNQRAFFYTGAKPIADENLGRTIDSVMSDKPTLADNKALTDLMKGMDCTGPVWSVATITQSYRLAEGLQAFDSINLVSKTRDAWLDLTYTGTGKDATAATNAVRIYNSAVGDLKTEMSQAVHAVPAFKPLLDIVDSIKVVQNEGNVTLTATMPRSIVEAMINAPASTRPSGETMAPAASDAVTTMPAGAQP